MMSFEGGTCRADAKAERVLAALSNLIIRGCLETHPSCIYIGWTLCLPCCCSSKMTSFEDLDDDVLYLILDHVSTFLITLIGH